MAVVIVEVVAILTTVACAGVALLVLGIMMYAEACRKEKK